MSFQPGQLVFDINDPGKKGIITGRTRIVVDRVRWEVEFETNEKVFRPAEYLAAFATENDSLEQRVQQGRFGRASDLRRLLTFEKLKGTLHEFIYSMDTARIDFLEYQFKPVLKFVNSPTERLLIADEVGLGKTIESALIWLEMQARRNARRLLVVCPKMLAGKWRMELRHKFGVPAEIGTAETLLQSLSDIRKRGEAVSFSWICTYSGLRPCKQELADLDDDAAELSSRGRLCRELAGWDTTLPFVDLVIFDEAHYMRNPASATSRMGTIVSGAANAALLVSATPVANTSNDLFTLLRLIDPDFFDNPTLFEMLLRENRPAVQAATILGAPNPNMNLVLQSLDELQQSGFVGRSPLLSQAREQAVNLRPTQARAKVELQETLDKLNILGSYISRTRRVQVQVKDRPVRTPLILPVTFSEQEARFYRTITKMVRNKAAKAGSAFSAFHLILPQQRTASCIPAMVECVRSGDLGDVEELLREGFGFEFEEDDTADEAGKIEETLEWIFQHDFEANDSKYQVLRDLVLNRLSDDKIIIFAYFKGTLRYLFRRLQAEGVNCAMIHGDVPDAERTAELERFREREDVRILLSSEVGSEGIDLQFCRVVVNYDLPWNPMRVEQRIGRIDRVGQTAKRLTIVHFKVADTVEERLYTRLHEKLKVFENSIGDLETILGAEIQRLTLELLSNDLTPEEEEKRIEDTRSAIERRRLQTERLEAEGGSLLAHSDYIADKIGLNRRLGRYVTADELRQYIADFFDRHYQGCVLEWDAPLTGCFRLQLTFAAGDRLTDFIRRGRLETEPQYFQRRLICTLLSDVAKRPKVAGLQFPPLFVTHLSPLVRWITEENLHKEGGFYNLSALQLKSSHYPTSLFAYRIERWKMKGLREREVLAYAVTAVDSEQVMESEKAEGFVLEVLQQADDLDSSSAETRAVLAALNRLDADLRNRFVQALVQFEADNSNVLNVHEAQVRNHFQRRISADERAIATMEARGRRAVQIAGRRTAIANYENKLRDKLQELQSKSKVNDEITEVAAGIVKVEP
jgi:superfamily II DNA or RNA helicase